MTRRKTINLRGEYRSVTYAAGGRFIFINDQLVAYVG